MWAEKSFLLENEGKKIFVTEEKTLRAINMPIVTDVRVENRIARNRQNAWPLDFCDVNFERTKNNFWLFCIQTDSKRVFIYI